MRIVIKETKREGFVQITTLDERFYRRKEDGRDFVSNTWICGYVPMDDFLIGWIASKGMERAKEERNTRGRKGSRIHAAIEEMLLNGEIKMNDVFPDGDGESRELEPDEYYAVMTFRDWWKEYNSPVTHVLGIEMDYYNEALGYACTADLVCQNGEFLDIIDYKTGQSIHLEHKLQLEGIAKCDEIQKIATERKLTIRKNNLQVGYTKNKKGYKFTEHEEDLWHLWQAAHAFWMEENANKSPRQVEYPTTITIKE